jgi:CAAX protease family protein
MSETASLQAARGEEVATPEATPIQRSNWATNPVGRGWVSLFEFLLGSAIVIGHNVYHVVPNEVPILFVIGWISIRLRDGGWRAVGLGRPASWRNTVLIALAAAAVRILGGNFLVEPLAHRIWHSTVEASAIGEKLGVKDALLWLGIIWTFAAFGEEMSYRGYLLTRAADLGRRTQAAYWAAVIAVSVLFGYGHFYKGPTGIMDSAFAGLVLGAAYMLSRRNLWASVLAHGFIDTFAIIAVLMGWNT